MCVCVLGSSDDGDDNNEMTSTSNELHYNDFFDPPLKVRHEVMDSVKEKLSTHEIQQLKVSNNI